MNHPPSPPTRHPPSEDSPESHTDGNPYFENTSVNLDETYNATVQDIVENYIKTGKMKFCKMRSGKNRYTKYGVFKCLLQKIAGTHKDIIMNAFSHPDPDDVNVADATSLSAYKQKVKQFC